MKTIIVSVKPRYAEQIMNGKKTIEVRKFYIEPPFKVVNYITQGDSLIYSEDYEDVAWNKPYIDKEHNRVWTTLHGNYLKKLCKDKIWNGKVAYEYVVNKVDEIYFENDYSQSNEMNGDVVDLETNYNLIEKDSCLSLDEALEYGKGKTLYGFHISDLKIYDKPKALGEFRTPKNCGECSVDDCYYCDSKPITKPPQNYVYCEVAE